MPPVRPIKKQLNHFRGDKEGGVMKILNRSFLVPTRFQFLLIPVFILALTACGGSDDGAGATNNNGPWLGKWILVNFLASDDNGDWEPDRNSGIGTKVEITETEWKEIDRNGCEVTFTYGVDGSNRITKTATSITPECGNIPLRNFNESGRLEFANDNNIMEDHFDVQAGDTLLAWRYLRQ